MVRNEWALHWNIQLLSGVHDDFCYHLSELGCWLFPVEDGGSECGSLANRMHGIFLSNEMTTQGELYELSGNVFDGGAVMVWSLSHHTHREVFKIRLVKQKCHVMCFGGSKNSNRTDRERLRQFVNILATNDFMQKWTIPLCCPTHFASEWNLTLKCYE